MQDWLHTRTAATPNRTALIFGDKSWTYAELNVLTGRLTTKLLELGIQPQRNVHIGMLAPNTPEAIVMIHALVRLGCTLVPLNTRLTPDEMNWQLRRADVRLLLYTVETAEIAHHLEPNRFLVDFSTLPDEETTPSEIELDAVQAVVFTSGTTGQPKGAEITYGNHFASAMASAYRLGHHPTDHWLSILPLYHVGGLAVVFRSTLYGITIVLHQGFDIDAIQHSFDKHPISLISLVPTMLYRLLDANTKWPPSLRLILLGGAAANASLMARVEKVGLPVATTYGLTEATSQVATALPETARAKPTSVGKPLMFTTVNLKAVNLQ
ncbi:MAG: AMP-binding protein, partial [Chloroflexota bacterium]